MVTFAYLTLAERKVMGRMQLRYGPNRAGPYGLLQPIADLLKLLNKESFQPTAAIDWLYVLGPFLAAFTALATFSVIPFGPGWEIGGVYIPGQVADLDIALILIFAIGSLGVYGFIIGGWASDSKYALLGSMRTCAQLVSYEVSLALSVLGVVIMAESLSLTDIVAAQADTVWYAVPQFVGPRGLSLRRHGRDGTRTIRPPRGRTGARRRLPHGVRGDAVRPLLDVGVHQPHHALRSLRDPLPRRLARSRLGRAHVGGPALVRREARAAALRLHLDASDAPTASLRPADAFRLEGASAGGDGERGGHGDPGGCALMAQPAGTLKGFAVTFRQIFRKPITQQYPEYKRPVYPRFRGRHRLWKHENGLEKCVGCSLCAAACPADCIRVVAEENTAENRVSAGERYARIYEINMSRCIFCGYCELACPFDAITLGNEFEIAEYSRDDLIYTKDMLLAEPIKRVPVASSEQLRHARARVQDEELAVGNFLVWVVWFLAAGGCLATGVAVVNVTNPFYAALALIGNLASLAVLYLLLAAEFLTAAQVLVYAGAVMVMFLFVVAYLGGRADAPWAGGPPLLRTAAVVAAAALLVEIVVVLGLAWGDNLQDPAQVADSFGSPAEIGELFLTDHLLAFEITSIVLLVAAVGGVVLGTTPEKEDD